MVMKKVEDVKEVFKGGNVKKNICFWVDNVRKIICLLFKEKKKFYLFWRGILDEDLGL